MGVSSVHNSTGRTLQFQLRHYRAINYPPGTAAVHEVINIGYMVKNVPEILRERRALMISF